MRGGDAVFAYTDPVLVLDLIEVIDVIFFQPTIYPPPGEQSIA